MIVSFDVRFEYLTPALRHRCERRLIGCFEWDRNIRIRLQIQRHVGRRIANGNRLM
jgi:hypothetical protein